MDPDEIYPDEGPIVDFDWQAAVRLGKPRLIDRIEQTRHLSRFIGGSFLAISPLAQSVPPQRVADPCSLVGFRAIYSEVTLSWSALCRLTYLLTFHRWDTIVGECLNPIWMDPQRLSVDHDVKVRRMILYDYIEPLLFGLVGVLHVSEDTGDCYLRPLASVWYAIERFVQLTIPNPPARFHITDSGLLLENVRQPTARLASNIFNLSRHRANEPWDLTRVRRRRTPLDTNDLLFVACKAYFEPNAILTLKSRVIICLNTAQK